MCRQPDSLSRRPLFNTDDTHALLKDMRGQEHLVLFSEHVELFSS